MGGEGGLHRWPCDAEDEIEEPGRGRGERHAVRADVKGVRLGGVSERYGALTGGVYHPEKVDPESNACHTSGVTAFVGDPEAEAREE